MVSRTKTRTRKYYMTKRADPASKTKQTNQARQINYLSPPRCNSMCQNYVSAYNTTQVVKTNYRRPTQTPARCSLDAWLCSHLRQENPSTSCHIHHLLKENISQQWPKGYGGRIWQSEDRSAEIKIDKNVHIPEVLHGAQHPEAHKKDRKSTRLNSSHRSLSRMPSSA